MRIALNVKNTSRLLKPIQDDVIIYDAGEWYVTTKEALLKEAFEKLDKSLQNLEEKSKKLETDNEDFKKLVSDQIVEMAKIIKTLIK